LICKKGKQKCSENKIKKKGKFSILLFADLFKALRGSETLYTPGEKGRGVVTSEGQEKLLTFSPY